MRLFDHSALLKDKVIIFERLRRFFDHDDFWAIMVYFSKDQNISIKLL